MTHHRVRLVVRRIDIADITRPGEILLDIEESTRQGPGLGHRTRPRPVRAHPRQGVRRPAAGVRLRPHHQQADPTDGPGHLALVPATAATLTTPKMPTRSNSEAIAGPRRATQTGFMRRNTVTISSHQ